MKPENCIALTGGSGDVDMHAIYLKIPYRYGRLRLADQLFKKQFGC